MPRVSCSLEKKRSSPLPSHPIPPCLNYKKRKIPSRNKEKKSEQPSLGGNTNLKNVSFVEINHLVNFFLHETKFFWLNEFCFHSLQSIFEIKTAIIICYYY